MGFEYNPIRASCNVHGFCVRRAFVLVCSLEWKNGGTMLITYAWPTSKRLPTRNTRTHTHATDAAINKWPVWLGPDCFPLCRALACAPCVCFGFRLANMCTMWFWSRALSEVERWTPNACGRNANETQHNSVRFSSRFVFQCQEWMFNST